MSRGFLRDVSTQLQHKLLAVPTRLDHHCLAIGRIHMNRLSALVTAFVVLSPAAFFGVPAIDNCEFFSGRSFTLAATSDEGQNRRVFGRGDNRRNWWPTSA
jgi:hypothetical protein